MAAFSQARESRRRGERKRPAFERGGGFCVIAARSTARRAANRRWKMRIGKTILLPPSDNVFKHHHHYQRPRVIISPLRPRRGCSLVVVCERVSTKKAWCWCGGSQSVDRRSSESKRNSIFRFPICCRTRAFLKFNTYISDAVNDKVLAF